MRRPLSLEENIHGLENEDTSEFNVVMWLEPEEPMDYCIYCHYSLLEVPVSLQTKKIDYSDKKWCTRCGMIYKRDG